MDHTVPPVPAEPAARRRGWAGWLLSGAFHGALIAILATVYWLIETEPPPLEYPPTGPGVIVTVPPTPVPPPSEAPPTDTLPDLPSPETIDTAASLAIDVEALPSDPGEDGLPFNAPIGVGGDPGAPGIPITVGYGPSSLFGPEAPPRRTWRDPRREPRISSALSWFKRHQGPDGRWSAASYQTNCADLPRCEPGDATVGGDVDAAMTGYAVMCFLGDGYDHATPSKYRSVVKKGLAWLVSVQKPDGLLGERNYEHAVAAKALIEAYAMTGDPALKDPAQRAVRVILARQNHDATAADPAYVRLGWDYVGPSDRNDSSVTGWNVMALKSALAAGLDVGDGLKGAKQWLERAWKAANPGWLQLDPYRDESRFPYTFAGSSGAIDIAIAPSDAHDLACVGAMSAVFLGAHAGDQMLETLANYVDRHELPAAYPCNTYKLYYDCLGMYQVGGERWHRWDERTVELLSKAQRRDGCFEGSWDFQDTKFHGHQAGRVLSTAYCCLSLEACYLYRRSTGRR